MMEEMETKIMMQTRAMVRNRIIMQTERLEKCLLSKLYLSEGEHWLCY